MSSILFCWELGAGYGHLNPHVEVLKTLQQRGHSINVVVRDLVRAAKAFEGVPCHYWQAPTPQNKPELTFNPTYNFTQILHNTGLGDPSGLAARIAAWKSIIAATRPRLALIDYCPTAIMALRGTGVATVLSGTGFVIPPNVTPFPAFHMFKNVTSTEKLLNEERHILGGVNAALSRHRIPTLNSFAQLYHDVSSQIIRSLPEFDHYPDERGPAQFLGLPPDPPRGNTPWPAGEGPKVFAYLKPYANLDALLEELKLRKYPTIVACDGIGRDIRQKHACPTISFVPPTVDVPQVGREAHFAITNGNMTTSARLLLQGCPLMCIPLQLEQSINSVNFTRGNRGVVLDPQAADKIGAALNDIVENRKHRDGAKQLAAKYANQPDNYVEKATAVLESFLGPTWTGISQQPSRPAIDGKTQAEQPVPVQA